MRAAGARWAAWLLLQVATADVLCDVRMSERQVMMVDPGSGDELYTASTLEVTCNDVYASGPNGSLVSTPWELYVKACAHGAKYSPFDRSCGYCPQEPKEAMPNLPENSWFEGPCKLELTDTATNCMCRWRAYDYEHHRETSGSFTVPITKSCDDTSTDMECFYSARVSEAMGQSQSGELMLPEYRCTGLPMYASSSDLGTMITPSVAKDPLYELLRISFADGFETHSAIYQDWQSKLTGNVLKTLFFSSMSRDGQDVRLGPSLQELADNCELRLNIYFDMEGTALNDNAWIPGGRIPTYKPLCVEEEVLQMVQEIEAHLNETEALGKDNIGCNTSADPNDHSHGRRLSKVDRILESWDSMEKAPRKRFSLEEAARRMKALRAVEAGHQRSARSRSNRRLQTTEEFHTITGQFVVAFPGCTQYQQVTEGESGEWFGGYVVGASVLGSPDDVKHVPELKEIEASECSATNNQVTVTFKLLAGKVSEGDALAKGWLANLTYVGTSEGLQLLSTAMADATKMAVAVVEVTATLGTEMVELVCEAECATLSCKDLCPYQKKTCAGCSDTSACHPNGPDWDMSCHDHHNGDDGTDGHGHHEEEHPWWELYEGMDCEAKRNALDRKSELAIRRAFIITGKDSYAGCKGFLNDWVTYEKVVKTRTTNKCTERMDDDMGQLNPKWLSDPCCNWVKRQKQCCAPREIEEAITVVGDVNQSNIAAFAAATNSGNLALDLAMSYSSTETDAAKSCFPPFKAFWDATKDIWRVVDQCRTIVEGSWSDTFQVMLGTKCTSDIDCYTGSCYTPVSSNSGSSGGVQQKYCMTPDAMEVPNWGLAILTCLIDKSLPEMRARAAITLGLSGSATTSELAAELTSQPGVMMNTCRGHNDAWNRHTETSCLEPKRCNFEWHLDESTCLNPCGAVSCPNYCSVPGGERREVSEMPRCEPKREGGSDIWQACDATIHELERTHQAECDECNEKSHSCQGDDCDCHQKCDFWSKIEDARRNCLNSQCQQSCTESGECAVLYQWGCVYANMSFAAENKDACLSECSAAGGPNPVAPKSCRAILNPKLATEEICWKLGQGHIETRHLEIPNWDWSKGSPPPESCIIKSYMALDGKPYVPPPPYGASCLPECEEEMESCQNNEMHCYQWIEDEDKFAMDICRERYEVFRTDYEACVEQQRASCTGIGCMRVYATCRVQSGLEADEIFGEYGCATCTSEWTSHEAKLLHCAEGLEFAECRWNSSAPAGTSQPRAPSCLHEMCEQAFQSCQINGGSMHECENQTQTLNQCRECRFLWCDPRCESNACNVGFSDRSDATRSCAGCDASAQCHPAASCYDDSSCAWENPPEFGNGCSTTCEDALRMCREEAMGFCGQWFEDQQRSQHDICQQEFEQNYRAAWESCKESGRSSLQSQNPDATWDEIEASLARSCADQGLPSDWQCKVCDGEWNWHSSWETDIGPKCLSGEITFLGKTMPSSCSACKPVTCPRTPIDCWDRIYSERQCGWDDKGFMLCNKTIADAKTSLVAKHAACSDCTFSHCSWECKSEPCSQIAKSNLDWRNAVAERCQGCGDKAICKPGADCFPNTVVQYTQAQRDDWTTWLGLFSDIHQTFEQCTGTSLGDDRRLEQTNFFRPPASTKAVKPSAELSGLDSRAGLLWRKAAKIRFQRRGIQLQLNNLKLAAPGDKAARARQGHLDKEMTKLRRRYAAVAADHQMNLQAWLAKGGQPSLPAHRPLPGFLQEEATSTLNARRLKAGEPENKQVSCTGTDCALAEQLCENFFIRDGAAQTVLDEIVVNKTFGVLPWEGQDQVCQDLGSICYISLPDVEAILLGWQSNSNLTLSPWRMKNDWCDGYSETVECSGCGNETSVTNQNCEGGCRCNETALGFYAEIYYAGTWRNYELCNMYQMFLRAVNGESGHDHHWHMDFDEKIFAGAGACMHRVEPWSYLPNKCHDGQCHQDEECRKDCIPPEPSKDMCQDPARMSFFASTRRWSPGILSTQSDCEAEACYPQPWIRTQEECATVNHCEGDCPYCETASYWDWEEKKTKVLCSLVGSSNSQPLSEGDCRLACGGNFTDDCYFKKDAKGTGQACIAPAPSDASGSTTYEKCAGQTLSITGGSVTTAVYTLLQCSAFSVQECGWASSTFTSMECKIMRLQCKNKADCSNFAGRCDYQYDDWKVEQDGGFCVEPFNISESDPHVDPRDSCWTNGRGDATAYGCALRQISTEAACTPAGGKWFKFAVTAAECELPNYAFAKDGNGAYKSGTMACCTKVRGSVEEGSCEMFTQDATPSQCAACGGTWMSIFKFRRYGSWVTGDWKKSYKWVPRQFQPENKWVEMISFDKVAEIWRGLISQVRAVPVKNYIQCRIYPTLDALVSISSQTAVETTLGDVPLLPGTDVPSQVGDYVITPHPTSVAGNTEIDLELGLKSADSAAAEAAANKTNVSEVINASGTTGRRLSTTLSDSLTASCYTVIKHNEKFVGQLLGDCVVFSPKSTLSGPVEVCMPTQSSIPVSSAFTVDAVASETNGVFKALGLTVARSKDGLSICAQLENAGTYCPAKIYVDHIDPVRVSANTDCGAMEAITQAVAKQAETLKATGEVQIAGLVKIGQSVAEAATGPVSYFGASGQVTDVQDFAQRATASTTSKKEEGDGDDGSGQPIASTTSNNTEGGGSMTDSSRGRQASGFLGLMMAIWMMQ